MPPRFKTPLVMIGTPFEAWTTIAVPFPQTNKHTKSVQWYVPCQCECGTYRAVLLPMLRNGHSSSCGECHRPRNNRKHGAANTRLYKLWAAMKQRCGNPKSTTYHAYGARGITVCQAWNTSFIAFRDWAMAAGYSPELRLERLDNDGPYTPENCCWATEQAQARNKRQTRFLTAFGETKCLTDWALDPRCAVNANSLRYRIDRMGLDDEEALTRPRDNRKAAVAFAVRREERRVRGYEQRSARRRLAS